MNYRMFKTLRVDIKHITEQELIEKTKEIVDLVDEAYIVVETAKISKKRHIQGILKVEDEKLIKKIRNIIVNKLLNKQGSKEDYSFTNVKDYDNYMVYLSKGECVIHDGTFVEGIEPQQIYLKGITQEIIIEYRTKAVVQQKAHVVKKAKKPTEDKEFIAYFKEHFLHKYEERQQSITGKVYHFKQRYLIKDILDYFHLKTKGYKRQVLEHKMHLLYNTIVREYEPEAFDLYVTFVHQEMSRIFQFG